MDNKEKDQMAKIQELSKLSDKPEILVGIVVETDPVRGVCKVAFESTKDYAVDIPYISPFSGVCGT